MLIELTSLSKRRVLSLLINDCYRDCSGQIRYPSYSLHTHLKLFLEKKSTSREPQLNQPPSVAYTRGDLRRIKVEKYDFD